MKIVAFASAALVSLAAFTGAASAAGIVPGSDYYTEAQADHQANTVIRGDAAANAPAATYSETRSFGYPAGVGSEDGIIPGSRTTTHAADTRDTNSVSRGDFNGGYVAGPAVQGAFVPGSGAF